MMSKFKSPAVRYVSAVLLIVVAGAVVFAGQSNFSGPVVVSTAVTATDSVYSARVTATTALYAKQVVVTDSVTVGSRGLVEYVTINLDSLGIETAAAVATFTPWRNYTLVAMELSSNVSPTTDSGIVWLTARAGAGTDTLYTDTLFLGNSLKRAYDNSGLSGSGVATSTALLTAARPCSVWVDDGGLDGTGDGVHAAGACLILTLRPR